MNNWRERIDPILKRYLERIIYETSRYRGSYKLASKPDNAQLWIAIATLSKQVDMLNVKLNYLENNLIEVAKRKSEVISKKNSKNTKKSRKKPIKKLEKSLKRY